MDLGNPVELDLPRVEGRAQRAGTSSPLHVTNLPAFVPLEGKDVVHDVHLTVSLPLIRAVGLRHVEVSNTRTCLVLWARIGVRRNDVILGVSLP